MFIKQILSQHRYDFTAILGCEHCSHEAKLTTGYQGAQYHDQVIPAMLCGGCGKTRAGGTETQAKFVIVETH